jgi:hypothetical protein
MNPLLGVKCGAGGRKNTFKSQFFRKWIMAERNTNNPLKSNKFQIYSSICTCSILVKNVKCVLSGLQLIFPVLPLVNGSVNADGDWRTGKSPRKMADSCHHVDMLANVENAVWHAFDFLGK